MDIAVRVVPLGFLRVLFHQNPVGTPLSKYTSSAVRRDTGPA